MIIFGIGTDILKISRIEDMKSLSTFAEKILSTEEHKLASSYKDEKLIKFLAKQFAAKEAITKAIGSRPPSLKNIQITNDDNGVPYVDINPDPAFISPSLHISISHVKKYAVAFAYIGPLANN